MACETQDAAFAGIHAEFVRQQAEIAKLRAALTKAVEIAREGCLVPPDGGSPTEEAREMCERIAERIAALLR
jgi:hypothetical protein